MLPEIERLRKFHTERRERKVKLTFEKSVHPMVWLDSSVWIDLAKIDKGEGVEPIRAAKLKRLRAAVRRAVRAEKLICPEWDQEIEFEGKRLEDEIRRIVVDLSCGARCKPHEAVKDQQMALGLQAYLACADEIHMPATVYFNGDPMSAVREAKRSHYIVSVDMDKPQEWLKKATKGKLAARESLETLRGQCHGQGRTFDEQLELERKGESIVMFQVVRDHKRKVAAGQDDLWDYFGVQGFINRQELWRRLGGPGPEDAALVSFMQSPYFWELPIEDTSCRLLADLLVRPPLVKGGDRDDIQPSGDRNTGSDPCRRRQGYG